ncbi:MAG: DUF4091 domain-containing protein [Bacteroidales bacterium]|nr:DUF4091 domain-containing protein [Bacteroidales bacterium]
MNKFKFILLVSLLPQVLLARIDAPDPQEWKDVKGVQVSWGDIDMRYPKHSVPMYSVSDRISLDGWRGERVYAQAVVWTASGADDLEYEISDLKGPRGHVIPAENISSGFVTYVKGDTFFSNGTGCGEWSKEPHIDSVLVADCIDHCLESVNMSPMQTQGIWFTCWIPSDVAPGEYKGSVRVRSKGKLIKRLGLSVVAGENVLPAPEDWHFHLDLWQNPYAVARFHGVELWTPEHFEAMRPLMTLLAKAGQKVITTTLIHKPWGGQTYDHFESMVEWVKKSDGTWEYGFGIFDRWVEFMMSCGITRQINCYSIAPWHSSFQYYDEATDTLKTLEAHVGTPEYTEFWGRMLKAFAAHLREKGWFERCAIAMDELPLETMRKVIDVIRKAEPDFKIALAGNYHPEIEKELYDYCIAYGQTFPEDVLARRKSEGKVSTYYTCCTELAPNLFTISEPEDAMVLALEMLERKSDGYLRWAYNSWPENPLTDSRFRAFTSGDTFIAYPGGRTSVRLERLVQGIQQYEKVMVSKNR